MNQHTPAIEPSTNHTIVQIYEDNELVQLRADLDAMRCRPNQILHDTTAEESGVRSNGVGETTERREVGATQNLEVDFFTGVRALPIEI